MTSFQNTFRLSQRVFIKNITFCWCITMKSTTKVLVYIVLILGTIRVLQELPAKGNNVFTSWKVRHISLISVVLSISNPTYHYHLTPSPCCSTFHKPYLNLPSPLCLYLRPQAMNEFPKQSSTPNSSEEDPHGETNHEHEIFAAGSCPMPTMPASFEHAMCLENATRSPHASGSFSIASSRDANTRVIPRLCYIGNVFPQPHCRCVSESSKLLALPAPPRVLFLPAPRDYAYREEVLIQPMCPWDDESVSKKILALPAPPRVFLLSAPHTWDESVSKRTLAIPASLTVLLLPAPHVPSPHEEEPPMCPWVKSASNKILSLPAPPKMLLLAAPSKREHSQDRGYRADAKSFNKKHWRNVDGFYKENITDEGRNNDPTKPPKKMRSHLLVRLFGITILEVNMEIQY